MEGRGSGSSQTLNRCCPMLPMVKLTWFEGGLEVWLNTKTKSTAITTTTIANITSPIGTLRPLPLGALGSIHYPLAPDRGTLSRLEWAWVSPSPQRSEGTTSPPFSKRSSVRWILRDEDSLRLTRRVFTRHAPGSLNSLAVQEGACIMVGAICNMGTVETPRFINLPLE